MIPPIHPHPAHEAEVLARRLFERLEYKVTPQVRIAGVMVDLVIERDGSKSPVEVKWWGKDRVPLSELREVAARLHSITQTEPQLSSPIVVVIQEVSPQARAWADETFAVNIWDNSFLLEKTKPYDDLSHQLSELSCDRHDRLLTKLIASFIGCKNMKLTVVCRGHNTKGSAKWSLRFCSTRIFTVSRKLKRRMARIDMTLFVG
jgi:hypothetical protein